MARDHGCRPAAVRASKVATLSSGILLIRWERGKRRLSCGIEGADRHGEHARSLPQLGPSQVAIEQLESGGDPSPRVEPTVQFSQYEPLQHGG
jgi:hypothetical protein